MNNKEWVELKERFAAGLRAIAKEPSMDYALFLRSKDFLFCPNDLKEMFFGINVLFVDESVTLNDDLDCPFVPIWDNVNETGYWFIGLEWLTMNGGLNKMGADSARRNNYVKAKSLLDGIQRILDRINKDSYPAWMIMELIRAQRIANCLMGEFKQVMRDHGESDDYEKENVSFHEYHVYKTDPKDKSIVEVIL